MQEITTIGLDIAKSVFQVHGIDASGAVIIRRQLRRSQVLPFFRKLPGCVIGIEACATAHHWGRELLALGHEIKLMPPRYVKPYVKRNKNDAADAEAICEAVQRPTMRFVPIKSPEQQSVLMLHRTRQLGSISKAGNRYLRSLLVVGALSVIRRAKQLGYTRHPWLVRLMERRSVKIAAIALANKIARIAWAMMARNESYRTPLPASA